MTEQDSQLEKCDVICKHCGVKIKLTYNGSAFYSSLRFGTRIGQKNVLPSPTTIKIETRNEAYKILLTCTNDAGSNYGDSGFIDVKTHGVNENFQLLP